MIVLLVVTSFGHEVIHRLLFFYSEFYNCFWRCVAMHTTVWRSSACHTSHTYQFAKIQRKLHTFSHMWVKQNFISNTVLQKWTLHSFFPADCVGQFEKQACFFSIDFFSRFLGLYYPLPLRIQCILNRPLHPLHFGDFGMDRYTLLPNRSKRYTNFEHKHLSLFGWCACFVMPRRLVAFIRGVTVHEVGINRKCFSGGSPSCISTVAGSSYLTWRFRVILAPVRGNRFFSTFSMQIFGTIEV